MSGRLMALVPAAGKSRRMGRPKLTMPLAGKAVIEHVVSAFRRAGIGEVFVVVGPHLSDLQALAEEAGARVKMLGVETVDMRSTVECGLQWIAEELQPTDEDGWFLVPADHPTLEPSIIERLSRAWERRGKASIVIPKHGEHRGHPALIGWEHVEGIRKFRRGVGLNVYLRSCGGETIELPVDSAGVLADLDTPDDYEKLRKMLE